MVAIRERFWGRTRAPSTTKVYKRELKKFEEWAGPQGVLGYPVLLDVVSVYLTRVAWKSGSAPMAERAAAALRSEHRKRGLPSPTDNPSIVDLMKGIINTYGRPPRPVQALQRKTLAKILESLSCAPSIMDLRTAWLALMSFQLTARCGDLKRLRVKDFKFDGDGCITICFKQLKNISVRRGFKVRVSPQTHKWCPVTFTKRYFKALGLQNHDVVLPVLYKRVRGKSVAFTVNRASVASNASLRLHFRDALRSVGVDATDYGLHSPRRGSAQALLEGGFDPASINTRVGWKSPQMLGRYTADSALLQHRQSTFLAQL